MIYVFLFLFWLSSPPAQAGAPPSEVIPWDSVQIVDTVYVADRPAVSARWVYFITRTKYNSEVLGMKVAEDLAEIRNDLAEIKAAIKAQRKKP